MGISREREIASVKDAGKAAEFCVHEFESCRARACEVAEVARSFQKLDNADRGRVAASATERDELFCRSPTVGSMRSTTKDEPSHRGALIGKLRHDGAQIELSCWEKLIPQALPLTTSQPG